MVRESFMLFCSSGVNTLISTKIIEEIGNQHLKYANEYIYFVKDYNQEMNMSYSVERCQILQSPLTNELDLPISKKIIYYDPISCQR